MKYIAILSSGTGGHVYPAYALSIEYIKKGYKIIWIGTKNGLENKVVQDESIQIKHVKSQGIRGKNFLKKIFGLFNFLASIVESFIIIKKYKPCLIFGFGGYVSVPGTISGFVLNIPVVTHEQNSIAGTANKINYFLSKRIFETFPMSFNKQSNKIIHTGNPVRDNFNELESPESVYSDSKSQINILILGGSQGSSFFNNTLPFAISNFDNNNISVKHICGFNNKKIVQEKYLKYKINAEVLEFTNDIDKCFNWSTLVVCRAGSTSISEIAKIGRASILIPFPYATDNHQLINAQYLAKNSATILLEQKDDFIENFITTINILLNDQKRLYALAKNIQIIFPKDAINIIVENSLGLIKK
jgi:UDP-N-acetylglucosamine--N-acetylmuramyl-(pentapeptide) pyrophosphoryl-undecaprenol N-acetylglucosamine transferase